MLAKLKRAEHEAEKLAEKAEKIAEKTAKKATKNIDGVGFLGGWTKNGAVKAAPDKFSFGLGGERKHRVHHAPNAGKAALDLTKVHHNHTTKLHKTKTIDTSDLSHIIDPKSCRGQCHQAWDLFIHIMHGIRHGLAQFVTCGMCFDRYNEKVIVVEEPDEHKKSCRADAQVFGMLNLLVLAVGGIGYLIAESFQPLPTYFRVTHFSVSGCSSKHVKLMEYVPANVCMKLKKQSVDLKKRLKPLADVRDVGRPQIQSGPPPLTAESQVITFTKHYRWGLSWFADQYTQETCVNAAELPMSIAQESGKPPLYPKTQVLDECLDRKIWESGEKSTKLSGSTCLGTSRLIDVVGYYDDAQCKSLIKAIAYNRTFYEDEAGVAVPFFTQCEFKKKSTCDTCQKNEKLQMYLQRIEVSDACKSEYDAFGAQLPNNGDNGKYTEVEPCVDEMVCPLGRGQFIEGTETEDGTDEDAESAAPHRYGGRMHITFTGYAGIALLWAWATLAGA